METRQFVDRLKTEIFSACRIVGGGEGGVCCGLEPNGANLVMA
jgi:hypothetical protein